MCSGPGGVLLTPRYRATPGRPLLPGNLPSVAPVIVRSRDAAEPSCKGPGVPRAEVSFRPESRSLPATASSEVVAKTPNLLPVEESCAAWWGVGGGNKGRGPREQGSFLASGEGFARVTCGEAGRLFAVQPGFRARGASLCTGNAGLLRTKCACVGACVCVRVCTPVCLQQVAPEGAGWFLSACLCACVYAYVQTSIRVFGMCRYMLLCMEM